MPLVLLIAACAPRPPMPAGDCPQNARLPYPPAATNRSVPIIVAWANTAASVANRAIGERDVCAASYAALKDWVQRHD
jgi:hypothetical protein